MVNLNESKKHLILAGALAAALCVTGVMAVNYTRVKNQLAQSQAENESYQAQLSQLQEQADTIQSRLDELTETKEELTQKLDEVSPSSSAAESDEEAEAAALAAPALTEATALAAREVATADEPLAQMGVQLAQLEFQISEMTVAYTTVSDSVVETLAYLEAIPNGDPLQGAGQFSSAFGYRTDPITGRSSLHTGLDLRAPSGTPIYATAAGTVIVAEYHNTYGNYIQIDHGNGYVTVYAHCSSLNVSVGDTVERGDLIAAVGATGRATGKHVHYEVRLNGQFLDPMDFLTLE